MMPDLDLSKLSLNMAPTLDFISDMQREQDNAMRALDATRRAKEQEELRRHNELVSALREAGRIFTGIDSLNSAALTWLDIEANGTYNYETKRIPREAFMEEAAMLAKVPYRGDYANNIRNVSLKYDVTYQGSRYGLPKDKVRVKEAVRIEEDEDTLLFIRAGDGVIIHTEKKAASPGTRIPLKEETKDEAVSLSTLQRIYQNNEVAMEYVSKIEKTVARYKNTHYRWVIKLSRAYAEDIMEEAMEHCLKNDKYTAYELAAYLIHKTGEGAARVKMKESLFYQCKIRAKEIEEELR